MAMFAVMTANGFESSRPGRAIRKIGSHPAYPLIPFEAPLKRSTRPPSSSSRLFHLTFRGHQKEIFVDASTSAKRNRVGRRRATSVP
jgi:hypothetical protein